MCTKKKVFISKYARIFTNSEVKIQKKALHLKKCANFHQLRSKTTKKGLYYKSAKKTVLAHEFWGDNQYLGSLRARTCTSVALSLLLSLGHNFRLGGTILIWGHIFYLGGTFSDLGRHGPRMPPVASGLLPVYSNVSNCNYRIFVTEMLLEIGFIEEMRII